MFSTPMTKMLEDEKKAQEFPKISVRYIRGVIHLPDGRGATPLVGGSR